MLVLAWCSSSGNSGGPPHYVKIITSLIENKLLLDFCPSTSLSTIYCPCISTLTTALSHTCLPSTHKCLISLYKPLLNSPSSESSPMNRDNASRATLGASAGSCRGADERTGDDGRDPSQSLIVTVVSVSISRCVVTRAPLVDWVRPRSPRATRGVQLTRPLGSRLTWVASRKGPP